MWPRCRPGGLGIRRPGNRGRRAGCRGPGLLSLLGRRSRWRGCGPGERGTRSPGGAWLLQRKPGRLLRGRCLPAGVKNQCDQELPPRLLHCGCHVPLKIRILQGSIHEAGSEIRLHDAVRESQAVAVHLRQPELVSPAGRQPDVKAAPGELRLNKALYLLVDCPVLRRLIRGRRDVLPFLWLAEVVVILDVDGVGFQPDARKRGKPRHGSLAFVAVQRHGRHEVALEERFHPRVEQAEPQLRAVQAAGIQLPGGLADREVVKPVVQRQFPGDLEIQRQFGQSGGLHDPVQPTQVVYLPAFVDVFERRFLAQRLQLHDGGIRAAERVMRA